MDSVTFWRMIEAAKRESGGDVDAQVSTLQDALAKLPPEEIIGFEKISDEMYARSYRWDLWGAAYLINGGCSDDGFDYFRGWLVAQGREVFEKALKDPDSLADVLTGEEEAVECEDMLYVAMHVYKQRTGEEEMPEFDRPAFGLVGEKWDEDDLGRMFPRLAEKFGWDEEDGGGEEEGEDE